MLLRANIDDVRICHGASTFAHKQADNFSYLSASFIHRWGLVLDGLHIDRPWPKEIEPVSTLQVRRGSLIQIFPPHMPSKRIRAKKLPGAPSQVAAGQVGANGEVVCLRASRSVVLR